MPIKPLQGEVRKLLRSSINLSSFSNIVEELLLNGVDAGATSIQVDVDLERFSVVVQDNGVGIEEADLSWLGSHHVTSKLEGTDDLNNGSIHTYGFKGEALASIVSLSNSVEIWTRTRSANKPLYAMVVANKDAVVGTSTAMVDFGTKIQVSGVFYNLPVRRQMVNSSGEVARLRQHIESIAIANPQVSFVFNDVMRSKCILQTRSGVSLRTIFSQIHGHILAENLLRLRFGSRDGRYVVQGYLSLPVSSVCSKDYQYFYVNGRALKKSKFQNELNNIYRQAAATRNTAVVRSEEQVRYKHPLCILDLLCPRAEYDITFEPDKTHVEFTNWDLCMSVFRGAISTFFHDHGVPLLDSSADCEQDDNFFTDDSMRVPARVNPELDTLKHRNNQNIGAKSKPNPYAQRIVKSEVVKKPKTTGKRRLYGGESRTKSDAGVSALDVRDPSWHIDVPRDTLSINDEIAQGSSADGKKRTLSEIASEWNNERYSTGEDRILEVRHSDGCKGHAPCSGIPMTVSREMLQDIEIIDQVDKKFIAFRARGVLLLIDQHAADERIRVEALQDVHLPQDKADVLQGRGANCRLLVPPKCIGVSGRDRTIIIRFAKELEYWGFKFEWKDPCGTPLDGSVMLTGVPEIHETVFGEPELREFMEDLYTTEGRAWKAPQFIHRLLNSKACRGAIMFGDVLSRKRCVDIMSKLALCRFPFQCAHGRPSVVPVADLKDMEARTTAWNAGLKGTREQQPASISIERIKAMTQAGNNGSAE